MSNDSDKTFEARVLDRYPKIRKTISESVDFILWRDVLPSIIVDGETFYIRGGDILNDEDQIIFEWARRHGWLSDTMIARDDDRKGGSTD
jgi:hypothetical protein